MAANKILKQLFAKLWTKEARKDWLLLLLAVACIGLAFVFGHLGSEVHEGELKSIDETVRQWVVTHRTRAGTAVFSVITQLGSRGVLALLGVFVAWRLFRENKRVWLLLAICALASAEIVAILKRGFDITRPAGGIAAGLGGSFPSGHASGSMSVAVVLAYIALRKGKPPWVVVTSAVLFVLLVGISRVFLDVHWTSDVIGGWLVGGAFGAGCCALYEWLQRRSFPDWRSRSSERESKR